MSAGSSGSANNQGDNSISGLVSTLLPVLALAGIYVAIFLILRPRYKRNYAPRSYIGSFREEERTPPLPDGLLSWIGPFWKIPDTWALRHQSLDSYLFLRYMRLVTLIAFVGCLITWPVLFPINATGGNGLSGLSILTFGNVRVDKASGRNRLYAHALLAWIYFGFILFFITRECIFYINLRQAFLLSPMYSNRISSRTVLFTSVPKEYLNVAKLRQIFGESVVRVWIGGNTDKVDELVEKRDKAANKLETAETKLIKTANANRLKALKSGASRDEETPLDESSGSVARRWLEDKKRPTHKTGKFGLIGPKVDSINWAREQLAHLIPDTEAAQDAYRNDVNPADSIPAVFIEFKRQSDAQAAYQSLSHHQALHMSERYIGVKPDEVVWSALKISWWQKIVRRFVVLGFITVLIVFWAIPVAFIGTISHINSLIKLLPWLSFINSIPNIILGVVTGLLPAVLLAILMSLVPVIMRLCAKLAGEPSLARVELFTQNAYFAFQVVQVFLVTTLSSGIVNSIQSIKNNPASTPSILSENLPSASNFYISFFILQGLAISSKTLSNVVGTVIFWVMYKLLAKTPRKMYNKWTSLSGPQWGSILPVYTNIVVIGICYSMIAPLILGFATCGLFLFYIAFRYNILYVQVAPVDTQGLIYPRALKQLFVGLYLSELCMIGLMGTSQAWGPLALMVIFLVFTILFQFSLNKALNPLLYYLPKSLEAEEETHRTIDVESGDASPNEKGNSVAKTTTNNTTAVAAPNMFQKFLKPHIYTDYHTLRRLVPEGFADYNNYYSETVERDAYYPPSVRSEAPIIWIPRDDAGISRQEVAHNSKVVTCTDEGASYDAKNKLVWDHETARPPIWTEPVYY